MEKWLKITHTNELYYVELPDSHGNTFLDAAHRELECGWIEFVYCRFQNLTLCLLIDECGKLKDGWTNRINNVATLLYAPGIDCIIGNALLGKIVGEDVVPLSADEYRRFIQFITSVLSDVKFMEASK